MIKIKAITFILITIIFILLCIIGLLYHDYKELYDKENNSIYYIELHGDYQDAKEYTDNYMEKIKKEKAEKTVQQSKSKVSGINAGITESYSAYDPSTGTAHSYSYSTGGNISPGIATGTINGFGALGIGYSEGWSRSYSCGAQIFGIGKSF